MLSVCSAKPFLPHRPDKTINGDLDWWKHAIESKLPKLPIFPPPTFIDLHAFSDASSSIGIAVVVRERWRAWRLLPGWQTLRGQRDIAWAEAIGFELLITILANLLDHPSHILVYGDNTSVVESWWAGRHRNREINEVFKRIHSLVADPSNNIRGINTKFIPSGHNPADAPSRGIYGATHLLLPHVHIPQHLSELLVDFDSPINPSEIRALSEHLLPTRAANHIERLKRDQEARERSETLRFQQDDLIRQTLCHRI